MKGLFLSFLLTILYIVAFSQAAPVANMRIPNATTAIGVNIPVGYIVYDVAADKLYICKTATASTATLTTGSANFSEVSMGAGHAPVTIGTANGLALSGQQISLGTASTSTSGALTNTDWNTFNGKVSSVSAGLGISVTGTTTPTVAVDTSNVAILGRARAANTYQAKGNYQTTTLANGKILVGNGSNVATAVIASGDAVISNTGAVTVSNAAGNMRVAGTLKVVGTTEDSSPDSILTVNAGIVRKSSTAIFAAASAIKTATVEDFEMATADSASAGHYYYALAHTPIAGSIAVQVNGMNLKPTTQYTIVATNKVRVGFSIGQYDRLQVSYSY